MWLSLAEKLVNAPAMLESSHSLPVPPPPQPGGKKPLFNPLFNPLAFVIKCQKVRMCVCLSVCVCGVCVVCVCVCVVCVGVCYSVEHRDGELHPIWCVQLLCVL